jgi:hypothetical protein
MNEFKPILRLLVTVQIFLLFAVIIMPALVRGMSQPQGKWAYGFLTLLCIAQALLLRRVLAQLE